MALQLQVIKPNGTESNYHRIVDTTLHAGEENASLSIELKSYLNEEYRNQGYHNDTRFYHFTLEQGEDFEIGIRELGYNKLKTLEEWVNATNC